METFLLIVTGLAVGWFVLLVRRPRRRANTETDGPGVDPALTRAVETTIADHARSRGYP